VHVLIDSLRKVYDIAYCQCWFWFSECFPST